jgi:thiol:disulfide interchange protein DsbD
MTGGLFGNWLQSPWVLGGIGILLFALALSMFGAYQIIAPYWLTSKLGDSGTGYIGLFLSGLVVGIFAAPCVGPPIIALLALVGSKGDALFGFQIFFTLAMGLGLPYLILGTFSNLLKKIPRSGVWMVWVERLFGVVLTAVAFFYFSMALVPKLSAYIIPVAFTVGGVYLGFLEPSGKEKKGLTWFKRTFGTIAVIAGIFIFLTFQKPGIEWEKYSPEKLEHAKAKGNTVILDFYADWCIPCLELDKKTFTDEQVIDATKYFVRLKVDLTKYDSPESEALRKQFNIAGVPTIIFINSRGEEVTAARIVGFLEAQEFIQKVMMVD